MFFVIQFSLTDTKTVQHESKKKKQLTTTGEEGMEEKNPQNCIRERKKAGGLNLFSFCKLDKEKQEALDALCVFSFVLRQSF